MKEALLKRLKEIAEELTKADADVTALEAEHRQIEADLAKLELRNKVLASVQNGSIEGRQVDGIEGEANQAKLDAEKRGKALLEQRAVTLASDIVLPSHSSNVINPTFNQVSSIVDLVDNVPVKGGESYDQPYIKGYGEGGYTAENSDAVEADPQFGYARITKTKITAYAEISKEMQKLPAADYDGIVQDAMRKALKKKIGREFFVGDGKDGHLTGVFFNPADPNKQIILESTDLEVSAITNTTLDDIVFSYGGEEDVEGGGSCMLIISKKDLKAFAKLRTTDGKKVHDIKIVGNGGTIDTVPFIISSACSTLSDSTTDIGAYCMAYGYVKNYKAVTFSDVEVQYSTDFKFRQGMVCYRGEVYIGGNVVAHNGFLRVKKAGTTIGSFTVTSEAGSVGKTVLTVDDVLEAGMKYKYKTAATVADPTLDAILTTGWTAWTGVDEIAATATHNIVVAKVDSKNKCKAFGKVASAVVGE